MTFVHENPYAGMTSLNMSYCGLEPSLTPIWTENGISVCLEATVGASVSFVLIFFLGGIAALAAKKNPDSTTISKPLKTQELICYLVSLVTFVRLIGVCIVHSIVLEFWVVDGLLTGSSWLATGLQLRGQRERFEPRAGTLHVLFWVWIIIRVVISAASFESAFWFWQHLSSPQHQFDLANWIVQTCGSVVLVVWTIMLKCKPQTTKMYSVNSDDVESKPLLTKQTSNGHGHGGHGHGHGVGDGGGGGGGHGHGGGGGHGHGGGGGAHVTQRKGNSFTGVSRSVKLLWPYVWPQGQPGLQIRILICVASVVGTRVANVYVPLTYKTIIDEFSTTGVRGVMEGNTFPVEAIGVYLVARFCQGGGIGSMGLLSNLRTFCWIPVQQFITRGIRVSLFKSFHEQDLKWHLSRKTGEVLRMMDRGSDSIDNLISYIFFNIAPTLLDIGIAVAYLTAKFGVYYGIITFCTMGSYIWFTVAVTEWRTKFRRTMNTKDNAVRQKATDSLLNAETVKLYCGEAFESKVYKQTILEFQKHEWNSQASLTLLNVGQSLLITVGMAGGTFLCGYQVSTGQLTVGDFVLFVTYITQLYMPLNWFGTYFRMIQAAMVDMENMLDLFDIKPDIVDAPNAIELPMLDNTNNNNNATRACSISFKDVHFSYEPRKPILRGVSFEVPAGKTCAIVGSTGSGKSTIMRLLFRFYDVTSGEVLVNNVPITTVTTASLRGVMGVVPQDTVLFHDTIKYNIRYGDRDASEQKIIEASEGAEIHASIEGFPDKYETIVGERGLKLSGGEKQRVAIARTILKKPLIVMLDEATSALDSETERMIQKTLNKVSQNRTTVVIAHRLSTVINADQILVVKEGQIVERGVHEELLEKGGHYSKMWEAQIHGLDEDELKPTVEII